MWKLNLEMERAQRMKSSSNNVVELVELPLDILLNILSRLPAESLFHIRTLSKALLNIVDDPSLARAVRHKVHLQVPHLVLFDRQRGDFSNPTGERIQLLASLQSMKYDGCRALTKGRHGISVTARKIIDKPKYSFYFNDFVFCNLFLLRPCSHDGGSPCFLVNPLRGGEVLKLPPLNKYVNVRKDWFGMGFDCLTNAHKIVRVSRVCNDSENRLATQVLVLGQSSWREIPSVPPRDFHCIIDTKNACANGDMHWLIRGKDKMEGCHILSFDFKREEFYWTPHPLLQSSNVFKWTRLHLVTLRGSLALLSSPTGTKVMEIWVLRDYDKKEWSRDYIINYCDMARCYEWEHGIFFTTCMDTMFVDLNRKSMNRIKNRTTILSYTCSLLSLKEYGNLLEELPEEPSEYGGQESYNKLTKLFDEQND